MASDNAAITRKLLAAGSDSVQRTTLGLGKMTSSKILVQKSINPMSWVVRTKGMLG